MSGAKFNWEEIRKMLDEEAWEEDMHDPYQEIRQVYVGSVFSLTPSGKYYMPWACSNVTEEEAEKDEEWLEDVEEEASKHDLFLSSGEGDPCDILVGECREKELD